MAHGRVLAVLVVGTFMAGCVGQSSGPGGPSASGPTTGGWKLSCYGGFPDWNDSCTSRATRRNGPSNENWIAINPTDPLNVVVMGKDYNPAAGDCVWMGVEVTKDGGRTWTESYLGGDLSQRGPTDASFGYTCSTDPMFAFDAHGVLYASFEAYSRLPNRAPSPAPQLGTNPVQGGQDTLFIATSRDGGSTFGPFVTVWQGDGIMLLQDRTMIAANPVSGSIHFCWSQRVGEGTIGQVLVATSRDAGATWDVPVVVSRPNDARLDIPCALTTAPDGTVYVGWYSLPPEDPTKAGVVPADEGGAHLELSVSTDDGRTYSVPTTVQRVGVRFLDHAPHSRFYVAPDLQMAVAPGGDLHLVWNDNSTGHFEVMAARGTDHGRTFSAPVRVAGADADDHARFHGAVAVDADGRLHVTYFDRQYDAEDRLLDLTWATSMDGVNFTHQRITAASFDGDLSHHQSDVPFIGDYNGLAVAGKDLYASFPDTHMGRSELAVAHFVKP